MSKRKRSKGQRARARKAKLAALRAEVVLVLEGRLLPHHLTYNTRDTQHLLEDFRLMGGKVPLWAQGYVKQKSWMDTPAKDWIYDDERLMKYQQAFDAAMVTGTGIVRLTPSPQPGTIMTMD